ncbi:MAG: hypothetical protein WA695_01305 [Candidatus Dormiibacterota bacterium]
MGEKSPEVIYLEGEDILVLRFGESRPAVTLELGDGLLARIDPETEELVGFDFLNYRERAAESEARSPSSSPSPRPRRVANGARRFLPKGLVAAS